MSTESGLPRTPPGLGEIARLFLHVGMVSFGGPAGQIALMHRELVARRGWLAEEEFLRALSFCMMLPGPEAMQLATYAGWRLGGIRGGLVAGGLFVLPGAAMIFLLAFAYGALIRHPLVAAMFLGIKATVVAIVLGAIAGMTRRALRSHRDRLIAALSFLGLVALAMPFPLVVLLAGLFGFLATSDRAFPTARPVSVTFAAIITIVGLVLWWMPVLWATLTDSPLLQEIGLFYSRLAVVTFGGAYAVLGYLAQEVVEIRGWVTTPQLMDALGLAETTPGPLILVTTFVAILAGLNQGSPSLAAMGGLMALWVTFVPCFIWILAGAPFVDWLNAQPRLRSALAAIMAAVVGVIANLSFLFAIHVAFGSVGTVTAGPIRMAWPDIGSLQPLATGLVLLACWLLLIRGLPMIPTLMMVSAAAGLLHLAGAG
ncbi:chromate transporter, chromate ion transporter (CHR) family [Rubellimicrobium thermophilum DSM 16684]|uniref:Chromate transporter, chromate ion transporter (CHR) family n=1 Tax=Rubellimicrobium thermophilum DSM 16684 TaxID=1123069 RepID=S9SAH3_9RHOB|nr:chromate efflux transporter [Rubellimicrobium thermophilum]EPX87135.1 chromate transporter, chromate ion transporter (CHR) family [Rubellimicrobium thermophilum DSM 16684]